MVSRSNFPLPWNKISIASHSDPYVQVLGQEVQGMTRGCKLEGGGILGEAIEVVLGVDQVVVDLEEGMVTVEAEVADRGCKGGFRSRGRC